MITAEQIRQWTAAGESACLEFKGEENAPLNDTALVETVVCLLNRGGSDLAHLLVGVEDDGRITGARPRHEAGVTDPARVAAMVAARTRPSVSVRVEEVPVDGRPVLVVEIPPSTAPVGTSDGRYLRRGVGGDGKPACFPFHFHEMQSGRMAGGVQDFSSLAVTGATWADLDPLEFERYRRFVRQNPGRADAALADLPDLELAKALGAVEANGEVRAVRVLGLLLFGKEEALRRYLSAHEVAIQAFDGTRIETNEIVREPLLRVMERAFAFFQARNRSVEVDAGLVSVSVPDYPERAFREALANAVVHRDYTRIGAVHFQWYPDRIELSNPGGLPEGVRLDNLLVTPPRPRNPLLADALKRAGLVERTARGVDTIFEEQLRNGRPAPSYERTTPTDVVLVLPGGAANLAFIKFINEEARAGKPLRLEDLLLLNALHADRSLACEEAAAILQRSVTETRQVLARLAEAGLVETRGNRRGRTYHLSAPVYRQLGEKSGYVRQRGFDLLQQRQMVQSHVKTHGNITRKETSELCRINGPQAYYLLKTMEKSGLLKKIGTRGRNVAYGKAH